VFATLAMKASYALMLVAEMASRTLSPIVGEAGYVLIGKSLVIE
jgi:hypothetical protein